MFKKFLMISLGLATLLSAYFLTANWFFYHQISIAKLTVSDIKHKYIFNEAATSSPGLIYVALGDSLTAGVGTIDYQDSYPYLVAQKLAATELKVTHLNYSYPGAKTADIIYNLLDEVVLSQPDVVTLLIGVNDAYDRVDSQKFRLNYESILKRLTSETSARVNVISIPLIGSKYSLWPGYRDYYHVKSIALNNIIKELADQYQVNYIDLTDSTKEYSLTPDYYAADGFHPAGLGYQYWAEIIYEHLN